MRRLVFEDIAFDQYSDWARENFKTFDKIGDLLRDIQRNPFKGIGKPEPLKHHLKGSWSRRIDEKHRLIYSLSSTGEILIISCKGQYD